MDRDTRLCEKRGNYVAGVCRGGKIMMKRLTKLVDRRCAKERKVLQEGVGKIAVPRRRAKGE